MMATRSFYLSDDLWDRYRRLWNMGAIQGMSEICQPAVRAAIEEAEKKHPPKREGER